MASRRSKHLDSSSSATDMDSSDSKSKKHGSKKKSKKHHHGSHKKDKDGSKRHKNTMETSMLNMKKSSSSHVFSSMQMVSSNGVADTPQDEVLEIQRQRHLEVKQASSSMLADIPYEEYLETQRQQYLEDQQEPAAEKVETPTRSLIVFTPDADTTQEDDGTLVSEGPLIQMSPELRSEPIEDIQVSILTSVETLDTIAELSPELNMGEAKTQSTRTSIQMNERIIDILPEPNMEETKSQSTRTSIQMNERIIDILPELNMGEAKTQSTRTSIQINERIIDILPELNMEETKSQSTRTSIQMNERIIDILPELNMEETNTMSKRTSIQMNERIIDISPELKIEEEKPPSRKASVQTGERLRDISTEFRGEGDQPSSRRASAPTVEAHLPLYSGTNLKDKEELRLTSDPDSPGSLSAFTTDSEDTELASLPKSPPSLAARGVRSAASELTDTSGRVSSPEHQSPDNWDVQPEHPSEASTETDNSDVQPDETPLGATNAFDAPPYSQETDPEFTSGDEGKLDRYFNESETDEESFDGFPTADSTISSTSEEASENQEVAGTNASDEYQASSDDEYHESTDDEYHESTGDEYQAPTGDEYHESTGDEYQAPTGDEYHESMDDEYQATTEAQGQLAYLVGNVPAASENDKLESTSPSPGKKIKKKKSKIPSDGSPLASPTTDITGGKHKPHKDRRKSNRTDEIKDTKSYQDVASRQQSEDVTHAQSYARLAEEYKAKARGSPTDRTLVEIKEVLSSALASQNKSSEKLAHTASGMRDVLAQLLRLMATLNHSTKRLLAFDPSRIERQSAAPGRSTFPDAPKPAKIPLSGHYYGDLQFVEVKVVFIRIMDIDTINQLFEAEVYIQARWSESQFAGMSERQLEEIEFYQCWDPHLKILNVSGSLDSETTSMLLQYEQDRIYPVMTYMWHVTGQFREQLELQHFPLDVQELSIILSSDLPMTEIDLVSDFFHPSHVSERAMQESQEWKAFYHVEFKRDYTVMEFMGKSKHAVLVASAHVKRKLGFYFWNIIIIVLLILGLSLTVLAIDATSTDRLSVIFTLFLTAVAFKLVVKTTLPTISYLTYLDIYIVFTLAYLALQAAVNAMMVHLARFRDRAKVLWYDEIAQSLLVVLLILFHAAFFIYIQLTAQKRRRQMQKKDHDIAIAKMAPPTILPPKLPSNDKETQTDEESEQDSQEEIRLVDAVSQKDSASPLLKLKRSRSDKKIVSYSPELKSESPIRHRHVKQDAYRSRLTKPSYDTTPSSTGEEDDRISVKPRSRRRIVADRETPRRKKRSEVVLPTPSESRDAFESTESDPSMHPIRSGPHSHRRRSPPLRELPSGWDSSLAGDTSASESHLQGKPSSSQLPLAKGDSVEGWPYSTPVEGPDGSSFQEKKLKEPRSSKHARKKSRSKEDLQPDEMPLGEDKKHQKRRKTQDEPTSSETTNQPASPEQPAEKVKRKKSTSKVELSSGETTDQPASPEQPAEKVKRKKSTSKVELSSGETTDQPASPDQPSEKIKRKKSKSKVEPSSGDTTDQPASPDQPAEKIKRKKSKSKVEPSSGETTDQPASPDQPAEKIKRKKSKSKVEPSSEETTDQPASPDQPAEKIKRKKSKSKVEPSSGETTDQPTSPDQPAEKVKRKKSKPKLEHSSGETNDQPTDAASPTDDQPPLTLKTSETEDGPKSDLPLDSGEATSPPGAKPGKKDKKSKKSKSKKKGDPDQEKPLEDNTPAEDKPNYPVEDKPHKKHKKPHKKDSKGKGADSEKEPGGKSPAEDSPDQTATDKPRKKHKKPHKTDSKGKGTDSEREPGGKSPAEDSPDQPATDNADQPATDKPRKKRRRHKSDQDQPESGPEIIAAGEEKPVKKHKKSRSGGKPNNADADPVSIDDEQKPADDKAGKKHKKKKKSTAVGNAESGKSENADEKTEKKKKRKKDKKDKGDS